MRASKSTESKIHPQMLPMLELLATEYVIIIYAYIYKKEAQKYEQEITDYVF